MGSALPARVRPARPLLLVAALALAACAAPAQTEVLDLHLFFSPSCPHCHPVRELLARMALEHADLTVHEHNLTDADNVELMVDYYVGYEVPEEQWGGTMAAFVGDRWWSDGEQILNEIEPATLELPTHQEARSGLNPGSSEWVTRLTDTLSWTYVLGSAGDLRRARGADSSCIVMGTLPRPRTERRRVCR